MNTAVVMQYGPGPNQVGNTVIAGHNYRNGQFFSNNYKLENGDTIYITDNSGTRLQYTIYNKYETSEMMQIILTEIQEENQKYH